MREERALQRTAGWHITVWRARWFLPLPRHALICLRRFAPIRPHRLDADPAVPGSAPLLRSMPARNAATDDTAWRYRAPRRWFPSHRSPGRSPRRRPPHARWTTTPSVVLLDTLGCACARDRPNVPW